MVHSLKVLPEYFCLLDSGLKHFEVRYNDRDFKKNDFLALNEFDGENYTGRHIVFKITYILDDSNFCKDGYVIMSLSRCVIEDY